MLSCAIGSVSDQTCPVNHQSFIPENNEERLLWASATGDLETVEKMLNAGVDIETSDSTGKVTRVFEKEGPKEREPLHLACSRNQVEVARYLLERAKKEGRIIVHSSTTDNRLPLTDAIISDSQECIQLLLDSEQLDIQAWLPASNVRYCSTRNRVVEHCVKRNPFLFAISRTQEEVVAKMLHVLGKQAAEKEIKPLLTPLLLPDLSRIVLQYHIGDSGDFLNNKSKFGRLTPLRCIRQLHLARRDPLNDNEKASAGCIAQLLIDAGAKLED